jgi:GNAT superfamily N-acetyltransferase
MEFVEATQADIPEIVMVLKSSLGEGLMPKSGTYFTWKHIQNPFGISKIILAKENGAIVGVRAFMNWEFCNEQEKIRAVRAVDTATLPEHQGKGIFSKLTMQAVEACGKEGYDLVFNSPNTIILRGYLKLGWYSIGKMPIFLNIGSLPPSKYSEKKMQEAHQKFDVKKAIDALDANWKIINSTNVFQTPLHKAYLTWRYVDCPVANYGAVIEPGKFGIIFRLKKWRQFVELRICESWVENEVYIKELKAAKSNIRNAIKPAMITAAAMGGLTTKQTQTLGLFGPFFKGPLTTLRKLGDEKNMPIKQFENWSPSMGTMELF